MLDKLYRIKSGAITLYVDMKYSGISFMTTDGNQPVAALDYLQYGRKRHYIEPDALKQFS